MKNANIVDLIPSGDYQSSKKARKSGKSSKKSQIALEILQKRIEVRSSKKDITIEHFSFSKRKDKVDFIMAFDLLFIVLGF